MGVGKSRNLNVIYSRLRAVPRTRAGRAARAQTAIYIVATGISEAAQRSSMLLLGHADQETRSTRHNGCEDWRQLCTIMF